MMLQQEQWRNLETSRWSIVDTKNGNKNIAQVKKGLEAKVSPPK